MIVNILLSSGTFHMAAKNPAFFVVMTIVFILLFVLYRIFKKIDDKYK